MNREEEWEEFVRGEAQTLYHPVGTCKMGSDAMAVRWISRLRVRGIAGLRVVDASVMPRIIAGNTIVAPTIMIAEKAADMIRAEVNLRNSAGRARNSFSSSRLRDAAFLLCFLSCEIPFSD